MSFLKNNSKNIFKKLANYSFIFKFFLWCVIFAVSYWFLKKIGFRSPEHWLRFFEIIAWPSVVVILLSLFKKIFTYLFLSVREFNIFGAHGRLRDPYEVIEERTAQKYKERITSEEHERHQEVLKRKIQNMEEELNSNALQRDELFLLSQESLRLLKEYRENNDELFLENQELLHQLEFLKDSQKNS